MFISFLIMLVAFQSCGKEGAAIAPGGTGSAIEEVKADCNGVSCI